MIKRKFFLLLTLVAAGCGESPTVPPPPEPEDVTMAFAMPWPIDGSRRHTGVENVSVTCLEGCPDDQVRTTDSLGNVTFLDVYPPLVIEARKVGYITRQVSEVRNNYRLALSHVWPDEVEGVIDQLGLAEPIASGKLFLRWGEDEGHLASTGVDVGGMYVCEGPVIVIRKYEDRDFMVWVLIHEAMHAWQGLKSSNSCNLRDSYPQSEEGRAWAAARDKDTREHGPYLGLDDQEWASQLQENQAAFYSHWYMGRETKRLGEGWDRPAYLQKLYQLAPNRSKYFEDRFGPPPPR